MIVADQSEAIAFLSRPATHGAAAVERIDTHGAVVFLAGPRAYKLKRAVKFSYMDFSTAELRRRACEAELALNRRTAPELYLEVRSINRADGGLAFGGDGPVLDWVVVMRRFDQDMLFDRLAGRGALTPALMVDLAGRIASFHDAATPSAAFGGAAGIRAAIDGNAGDFAVAEPGLFDAGAVAGLTEASTAALARIAALLDRRRAAGKVRRCHGDLHLRNICLDDGRPTLFDCIEFNDAIATIDVLYDLSFLLMDLEHRRLRPLGNAVFNRYLDLRDEADGLAALPLFLSLRAAIRAHVGAAAAAAQPQAAASQALRQEARGYLTMAADLLRPAPPALVAIGGLSGTGKSTLAYGLAPELGAASGARVLRSDVIRKRLMQVAPETRLPETAYRAEVTARVYAALHDEAAAALAAGHGVIVDAVFGRPAERAAMAATARAASAPFAGLWLEAPVKVLEARLGARRGDASDATAAVLRRQLAYDLGEIAWPRIDAGGDPADTLAAAWRRLAPLIQVKAAAGPGT